MMQLTVRVEWNGVEADFRRSVIIMFIKLQVNSKHTPYNKGFHYIHKTV